MKLIILLFVLMGFAHSSITVKLIDAHIKTSGKLNNGLWLLDSNGEIGDYFHFSEIGEYNFTIIAKGTPLINIWPLAEIRINNKTFDSIYVVGGTLKEYEFKIKILRAGTNKITIAFVNDKNNKHEDRNLFMDSFTISSIVPSKITLSSTDNWVKDNYEYNKALEDSAISKAKRNIELYRKGDAIIYLKDKNNNPLNNVSISATQISHNFLFGCDIFLFDRFRDSTKNTIYKNYFKKLFNYATIEVYWKRFEPTKGHPYYTYTDSVIAWCIRNNIKIRLHAISGNGESALPSWNYKNEDLYDAIHKRTEELLSRYKNKTYVWNIINEPYHTPLICIDSAYIWARKTDPNALLEINEYSILHDGLPGFYNYLENAINRGVPFDIIGIEAHEPKTEWFNLNFIDSIIYRYGNLGKKIEITEFTPTSGGQNITGTYKQGIWNEENQAEYAKKFYTICFGNPNVSAITWWDLPEFSSWLVGGGLLHKDLTPKLVYDTLNILINYEWKTKATGLTDNNGEYRFRGFEGNYLLLINDGKNIIEKRILLKAQNNNKYYFTF
jgi:GH35 family endo-1,4-beta-xylanase